MRPDYLAFFRRWARGLDRTQLAQAVAAAGLRDDWTISGVRRWSVHAAVEAAERRPPRELSSLWNAQGAKRLVWADAACMLENPQPTGTAELLHLLQEAAESAFMEWPEPLAMVTWELPIRVAVLGDDPVSRELANAVEQHPQADLVRRDDADVLVVVDSLRSAAARILGGAVQTPDLVVVLGSLGNTSQAWSLGLGLSGTAAGLAVLDPPADPLRIVHALLDEFTHDVPLDVALHTAARQCGVGLTAWLSAELIRRAHPSASLDRLLRRLRGDPTRRMATATLPEPISDLIEEAPDVSARAVADVVSRVVRDGAVRAETTKAEAVTSVRRWLHSVAPEMTAGGESTDESTPRSVQTRWMRELGDRHEQIEIALEPGRPHVLEVCIGPDAAGWTRSVPFPIDEIDPERRGTTVTIAYARVPGPDEPPASDDLHRTDAIDVFLPPTGASGVASFDLVPLPGRKRFFARITVLHRNRVIQTTLVSANVAPASEQRPLEPLARHQVVDGFGNLSRNRSFDAAIVFNDGDDDDTHPAMYVYAGKAMAVHDISGLAAATRALGAELNEYTVPKYGNKGISKSRLTELLRRLSYHGRLLWEPFEERLGAVLTSNPPRIQVVATADEELVPVELAYRRFAPTPEAELCEHWKKALGKGNCTGQCKTEGIAQRDVICPLGFLGLNAVIERRSTAGGTTSTVRPSVDLSHGALVAMSTRVDKDHETATVKPSDELEQAVARVASSVQRVTDMGLWESSVARAEPPVSWFVLLPHVEGSPPQMEIGDVDHPFQSANLEGWHLSREGSPRQPLVLLVGCNTALDPISFHTLMNRFLRKNASAVVATLSKVRGPEASAGVRRLLPPILSPSPLSRSVTSTSP
jgi:hypothetical protein